MNDLGHDTPQAAADDSAHLLSSPDEVTESHVSGDRDPLDRVAEEFVERSRRGENPSIAEYVARYPDQGEKVRKLLGAVAMMEQLRRGSKQARFMPERIGEFRVLRELGRGGMGVVYEAVQESLWRHVAVKAIHHTQLDMKRLQRFQREAQAVAQLHHTNIVPIFGVGEHEGVPYYAMQYIRGRGLDALLDAWRRDNLLPTAERWRLSAGFAAQAAGALDYAHGQGVLHRDIKPANLLIDEHEAVWITDFGLAKMVGHEELTASGDVIGTLRYLAPECLRGISEGRSDVYSLGLTFYEMITLRPPFGDLTPSELLHRVSEGQPVRPRQVDPTIPRDLETIVLKATARDLKDRYATAGALADDLHCFLNDRPIAARQANFFERSWRWSRRNRSTAALLTLAACSIVLAAIAGWSGYVSKTAALRSETVRLEQAEENVTAWTEFFVNLFDIMFPEDALATGHENMPLADLFGEQGGTGNVGMFTDRQTAAESPGGEGPGPGPRSEPGPGRGHHGPGNGHSPHSAGFTDGPPPFPDDGGFGGQPPHGGNRFFGGRNAQETPGNLALIKNMLVFYDRFTRSQGNRDNAKLQSEAAWVYFKLGLFSERAHDHAAAVQAFDRTLTIFEELATKHPLDSVYFTKLLQVCSAINPYQTDPSLLSEIENRLNRTEALVNRLSAKSPQNVDYLRARIELLKYLGLVRYLGGDADEQTFQRALKLAGELIERQPEEGYPHSDRSDVLEVYALVLENQNKRAAALEQLEAAMEDLEWVAADGLRSAPLANRMESLADICLRLGCEQRSDEIQERADQIDPREPYSNRPKRTRPFATLRNDPGLAPPEN